MSGAVSFRQAAAGTLTGDGETGEPPPSATRGAGRTVHARRGTSAWYVALAVVVGVLSLTPFLLVLVISVGEKIEGAGWRWAFDTASYARFLVGIEWPESVSFLYSRKLLYSFVYAVMAALVATALAFPFVFLMTRQSRRAQTLWLVFLLSTVSVSEVFVVMGWDILLSNRSGLPMVFRETGVTGWLKDVGWFDRLREMGLANPRDLKFKPSLLATVATMSYLVWPYAVILLYPALARLDGAMLEAASTMGARPLTVVRTVVLPAVRLPLIASTLLLFVFLLGNYVAVSVFAEPSRQTLTVSIYQSIRGATLNAPFGAAQSVVLLVAAGACLALGTWVARAGEARGRA